MCSLFNKSSPPPPPPSPVRTTSSGGTRPKAADGGTTIAATDSKGSSPSACSGEGGYHGQFFQGSTLTAVTPSTPCTSYKVLSLEVACEALNLKRPDVYTVWNLWRHPQRGREQHRADVVQLLCKELNVDVTTPIPPILKDNPDVLFEQFKGGDDQAANANIFQALQGPATNTLSPGRNGSPQPMTPVARTALAPSPDSETAAKPEDSAFKTEVAEKVTWKVKHDGKVKRVRVCEHIFQLVSAVEKVFGITRGSTIELKVHDGDDEVAASRLLSSQRWSMCRRGVLVLWRYFLWCYYWWCCFSWCYFLHDATFCFHDVLFHDVICFFLICCMCSLWCYFWCLSHV